MNTKAQGTCTLVAIASLAFLSGKAQAYCWSSGADGVRSAWNTKVYDSGDWYYMDPEGKAPGVAWDCSIARRNELMSAYGISSSEWGDYGYYGGVCDFTTPLTRTIDTLQMLEVTKSSGNHLQELRDLIRGEYYDGNLNADCDSGVATTYCYVIGANQTDLHPTFFYNEDIVERGAALAHEAAHKDYGVEPDFSCGRSHTGDCDSACDDAYNHGGAYSWSADFYKYFCQEAVNTTTALKYRSLSWYNLHVNTRFEDNTYSTNGYPELTTCGAASPNLRDKLHAFFPMSAGNTPGGSHSQTDRVSKQTLTQASLSNEFSTAVDGINGPPGAHDITHRAQKFGFQSSDGLTSFTAFDLPGPFTIALWARFDPGFWNLNEPGVLLGKWIAQPGGRSFLVRYVVDYSTGFSVLRINASSNGSDSFVGDVPFTPTQGKWYSIVVQWADSGTATDLKSTIRVTIDNQPSTLLSMPADRVHNGGSPLTVAYRPDGVTLQQLDPWVGTIDGIGFWKRSITAAERTELFHGGIGREYPATDPGPLYTGYTELKYWQF